MLDALYISAIGLQAQKAQLDAAADNLANLGTTAFKRQSVDFASILDRAPAGSGTDAAVAADARPTRLVRVDLTPGTVHATGRALDVAIDGAGFFQIEMPSANTGYARAGSLQINADGGLSLASGYALKTDVRVPNGVTDTQILADGSVIALLAGDAEPTVLGQIELATFMNPESLQYRGDGVFTAPYGSVEPMVSRPGEDGAGVLAPRSLEGSNVEMTSEMVSLMLMQRVYELNSRVVQIADELMGMSNNLRRG